MNPFIIGISYLKQSYLAKKKKKKDDDDDDDDEDKPSKYQ